MQVRRLRGFPDTWGTHLANPIEYTGPTSYKSGGDTATPAEFGVASFAFVSGATSYSGTYRVETIYIGYGTRPAIRLRWIVASTNQEVGGGTNLSGETARLLVIGG